MDKYGKPHIELQWDMKLWWPHLEALVALSLGYKLTGDKELLAWFEKIHEYTWTRFPDKKYGEWFGYLNRYGEINNRCKGNRWKGCFHLPRTLYLVSEIMKGLK
jgi:N-acylglucosamine 2-epimerase